MKDVSVGGSLACAGGFEEISLYSEWRSDMGLGGSDRCEGGRICSIRSGDPSPDQTLGYLNLLLTKSPAD